jgi:hypothetical protein
LDSPRKQLDAHNRSIVLTRQSLGHFSVYFALCSLAFTSTHNLDLASPFGAGYLLAGLATPGGFLLKYNFDSRGRQLAVKGQPSYSGN